MKMLTLLEVGNLDGLVVMIIGIIVVVIFVISLVIAAITKVIYEWNNEEKFSKKQFWQTMLISSLIFGLISGFICGGM